MLPSPIASKIFQMSCAWLLPTSRPTSANSIFLFVADIDRQLEQFLIEKPMSGSTRSISRSGGVGRELLLILACAPVEHHLPS